ncbi:response regulator transcription factor [Streptomyces sp. SB3404]|uniref:Response regulator transcription factor n=1 Tax=Streptomyces boncukensis TaxID=2711219 RepID=A0A6G4X3C7_9ACTN|nr:response regulator transcription factor [Streptomyces boncukensis]
MESVIRVLVVHDLRLLRSGLAELLGKAHDMVIRSTPAGRALRSIREQPADVCVADADSGGGPSLEELGSARPANRLLVLGSASRPGALRRARAARALGFVDKNASPEVLLTGVRRVARGERFVDDALAVAFLRAEDVPLTARELCVLSVAAEGASIAEIANRLSLADGTVRNYMSAITRKTGARNRIDAIRISRGAGWL